MSENISVKCNVCSNESDRKCLVKKGVKVSINKKRRCSLFTFDKARAETILAAKAKAGNIPTQERPDWYWDKKLRKQMRKEAQALYDRQASGVKTEQAKIDISNPDCLASFRSTVSEN